MQLGLGNRLHNASLPGDLLEPGLLVQALQDLAYLGQVLFLYSPQLELGHHLFNGLL